MQLVAQAVSPTDFASQRQTMVDCQVRTFDVTDQDVIARFADVPRELFVPGPLRSLAYSDAPLEIHSSDGETRCLLAPLVLARMIQGANVAPSDRILDVAGAGGYSAAVLAGLGREVVALESSAELSAMAAQNFAVLGISNATTVQAPLDGSAGLDGAFDLILVNGAVEAGLEHLLALLAPGGRLVAIVKSVSDPTGRAAKAVRFDRVGAESSRRALFDAAAPVLAPFRAKPAFVF
ncbi:MAG: protein-L-isoaspartate(D-aspartate) O-methyltransferase [Hyphomicrobiales bacterium]|nr:protein-L-isoaspartate(D-aspartate) O-methyltransferase [Hyphomicrobiales bacterium]